MEEVGVGLGHVRVGLSVLSCVWAWSSSQTTNQGRHVGWGNWYVGQDRIPLVALVFNWEWANGNELEPVRRFKIMHPLAQR